MKQKILFFALISYANFCIAQNVGIGTTTPTEALHVVGNKALFQTNFVGIGTSTPTTGFTGFAMKNNVNTWYGMYVDAGITGQPFYGYALNGVAKAYQQFNGTNQQYEYYSSNPGVPDFEINATRAAFRNASFLGVGTETPTTGFTGFTMKNNVNTWYGSYVDAGATGIPFYGYALNGVAKSYLSFNGPNNSLEYHQTSDVTPEFYINGNTKAVFNTSFVGIGTGTPTTGFTGFAMKSAANTFYGMYVDAGVTGQPFYGYALNGVAKAYHQYNGTNSQYEYYSSNAGIPDFEINATRAAFRNASFLGVGTETPTTGFTGFTMKNNVNTWYGSYIDAGATGIPFYGYALNGVATAYTTYNGANSRFEYHHLSDATPDFYISNTQAAFPSTNFLGIGTTTPTTGFTGLALKTPANAFYGAYVDAGTTGEPFYGYALNGVAKSYLSFASTTNSLEYHQTTDATPDFYINGNTKAVFNTGFVGIGTGTPTTGFTGFAMKSAANTYYGSYVDAGATGIPFYGYALNGVATAYTTYNGTTNRFEYHHTTDATPDFAVSNTQALFPIQSFLGLGTSTPTTGFTGFTMKNNVNTWYGSYIDAGATGIPFYGYALNGVATAYTTYNGSTNQFEYHHTSDATPDFAVSNTQALFPIQTFLGLGTSTPTTGSATGFTMKNNVNTFYGMYIDAGITGQPFYGYALNGVATAWTELNGTNGNWELNYGGVRLTVSSSGNLGIGTSSPAQKLDVAGTIHASNLNGGATTLSTDASGNIIRTPSDARLKNNIVNINGALSKVLQMHGVTYNFIDAKRFGSNRQMGFLAQDLEQIIPEAVSSGGEYKSVNYQVLTALLAEAIKEQQKQIDEQKKENAELKRLVEKILRKN